MIGYKYILSFIPNVLMKQTVKIHNNFLMPKGEKFAKDKDKEINMRFFELAPFKSIPGLKKIFTFQDEKQKGINDGLPIGLGYFPVSFSFGILAVAHGLSWWEATLISMTNLTSAGQFAGLNIMIAAGSFLEMALAQFVINLRYSLMSVSLSQKIDSSLNGIHRWIAGFGVTDEIFVMAMKKKGSVGRQYFFSLMSLPYLGWALGTLAGALCGELLPPIICKALGIALYGMFIAILVPAMKDNKKILSVVLIAILLSCAFKWLPIINRISVGFAIILSAVLASALGAYFFPLSESGEDTKTPIRGEN